MRIIQLIILTISILFPAAFPLHKRAAKDDYNIDLTSSLGKGSNGDVHLATRKSDELRVAIKSPRKYSERVAKELANELSILQYLLPAQSPYIVKVIGNYTDPITKQLESIVMEYAGGGDLFQWIIHNQQRVKEKTIPASVTTRIMTEIALGLKDIHDQKVCHRDIKPRNILLTRDPLDISNEPLVKIADFGLSSHDNQAYGIKGSPTYISTEMAQALLLKFSEVPQFNCKSADVYSLGITYFVLLSAQLPYNMDYSLSVENQNKYVYRQKVRGQNISIPRSITPYWAILILSMTKPNAEDRFTIDQVLDYLNDKRTAQDSRGSAAEKKPVKTAEVSAPHSPRRQQNDLSGTQDESPLKIASEVVEAGGLREEKGCFFGCLSRLLTKKNAYI